MAAPLLLLRFSVGFVCLSSYFIEASDLFLSVSTAEVILSIRRAEFREVRIGRCWGLRD